MEFVVEPQSMAAAAEVGEASRPSILSEKQAATNDDFTIPELPRARSLAFVLLSPWDDPFYIGLDAIEIFTADGTRPDIASVETDAREGYGDVQNLLRSRAPTLVDLRSMYMCKYRSCCLGEAPTQLPITVVVTLRRKATIAMIRIWNYSESRVHALRGVCRMRIDVDGGRACIFRGEISCAFTNTGKKDGVNGTLIDQRPMGDTILFTTNEEILSRIAKHDTFINENYAPAVADGGRSLKRVAKSMRKTSSDRDFALGDNRRRGKSAEQHFGRTMSDLSALQLADQPAPVVNELHLDGYERVVPAALALKAATFNINTLADIKRPATGFTTSPAAVSKRNANDVFSYVSCDIGTSKKQAETIADENADPIADEKGTADRGGGIYGKVFHMELLANWGASDLIGLTGIQFLGPHSEALTVDGCVIRYRDGKTAKSNRPGTENKSLLRLLNGNNLTCLVDEMWLHDWDTESTVDNWPTLAPPTLSFNFAKEIRLSGVSIWNYNASSELSYCGVKCVQFYVNGQRICGPVLLRRAPGSLYFDYVQDILFDRCHLFRPLSCRPTTKSISAFLFELRLLSSWGDEFYIGLNGVELYNRKDQLMRLKMQNLAAFPESVNILSSIKGDPRSSWKLIDNINDTTKPHHMWLTPLLPNGCARIFFIFDAPEFVSRIRIYNYRKTPERGVRHIAITADDLIIFSGEVPQSDVGHTGILDVCLRDLD